MITLTTFTVTVKAPAYYTDADAERWLTETASAMQKALLASTTQFSGKGFVTVTVEEN